MTDKQKQQDKEAEKKYNRFKEIDPFPEIAPALLNSGDVEDYIHTTGMIEPFYRVDLKSASYAARIKGQCVYWDENGVKQSTQLIKEHQTFKLKPNSIAFIEVEPHFRLPNYIALRFNLTITNVYRGLLLGTGPLVDPGYEGKIYIPLHNLTLNDYTFEYNEPLIWIEFTKTSCIRDSQQYEGLPIDRKGVYELFPPKKKNKPLEYFLNKACKGKSVSSSLPDIKKQVREVKSSIKKYGFLGILAAILAALALIYPGWQLQSSYVENLSEVESNVSKHNIDIAQNLGEISSLKLYKDSQSEIILKQQIQIEELKKQISNLDLRVNKNRKSLEPLKYGQNQFPPTKRW